MEEWGNIWEEERSGGKDSVSKGPEVGGARLVSRQQQGSQRGCRSRWGGKVRGVMGKGVGSEGAGTLKWGTDRLRE